MNSSKLPISKSDQDVDYTTVQMKSDKPEGKVLKQKILNDICKLANGKAAGYQFKDEELAKCGVTPDKQDKVREAISKVDAAGQNVILAFFAWIGGQVGNFVDSVFKVIIVMLIFVLSLQVPYLNEQANKELTETVGEAESSYAKHQETIREFVAVMEKNKIKGVKLEQEIPQLKRDKEEAERWMKYKDKTVESILREVSKQPFDSQVKIDDLQVIYRKALINYRPGLPMQRDPYLNAGIISLFSLVTYLLLQSFLILGLKKYFRNLSLKNQLKKVI